MSKNLKVSFKHFKLGTKASIFYDPISGLKVTMGKGGKVESKKFLKSKKIKTAMANGHIIAIDENEFNKMNNSYNQDAAELKEEKKAAAEVIEKPENLPENMETEEEEETEDEIDESWKELKNADELKVWATENLELTDDEKAELDELDKAKKVKAFIEDKQSI